MSQTLKIIGFYVLSILFLVIYWKMDNSIELDETLKKTDNYRSDWGFGGLVIVGIIQYGSLIAGVTIPLILTAFLIFSRQKETKTGAFFSSSNHEMKNLLCGIGESEILDTKIKISKYPFEPSSVFPQKEIYPCEINSICWDSYPLLIRIDNEVIFISREYSEQLKQFAVKNKIETFEATRNWDWLLEPYVDTEYTEETDQRLTDLLQKNGILKGEIDEIRTEVKVQMYKYNFDTMLWDWGGLGLSDVLGAMRVKYNKEQFAVFYKRAMEIQLRTK